MPSAVSTSVWLRSPCGRMNCCSTPSCSLFRWKRKSLSSLTVKYSTRVTPASARLPCLPAGLHAGEALELFGEPGTGKTALLMACALQCIIPARFDGVAFGGHGEDAVLLDTDGGFDPLWLGAALQARFYSAVTGAQIFAPTPAAEGMEDKARRMEDKARRFCNECMGRLHVLQCCDRHQLLCSLYALPHVPPPQ